MKTVDILFVSNFSFNLNETFVKITHHIDYSNYRILTYRKTCIKNAYSYEEYLEEKFNEIEKVDSYSLSQKYKKLNMFMPVVGERFVSNYFFGTENSIGNKSLSDYEIDFLVKSYVIFLEEHISNAKVVFSGYADNFISIMTYYLSDFYNKRCITFHGIALIDSESCYLTETLFCKPCEDLITTNNKVPINVSDHIKRYDVKRHVNLLGKKKNDFKKPFFGVISQNIFDLDYIKLSLFGYAVKDKRIYPYLNIDNPVLVKKLQANICRIYNKIQYKIYVALNKDKLSGGERFIYFPLQHQPEASTGAVSPLIMNQIYVIENISKVMPLGFTLVVKEHPVSIGMREKRFYKFIQRLPRVKLLGDEYSGKDLILKSEIVIGYGGTSLFECVTNGKKIILISKDYMYSDSILVRISKGFEFLHNEIVDFCDLKLTGDDIKNDINKMLEYFYHRRYSLYDDFIVDTANSIKALIKKVI